MVRRPSDGFIGTVIGLLIVLIAPYDYLKSEYALWCWLIFFPGSGAIIGTVIGMIRRRRA